MNIRNGVILLAALAAGACGGGGGSGGGGSGDPTVNGTAEIVFPWTHSAATAPTLIIRGIAADPEGVAAVTVNGTAAAITARPASTHRGSAKAALEEGEVEWSAEVDLEHGENVVVVSVEDEAGDITEDVDTATIAYTEVPITFTLDPEGTRVVGLSYTLTPSGYVQHLVQHDYATLEQKVFQEIWTDPAVTCLRRFENVFLWLSHVDTNNWELREFDLTTEQESLLVEIPEDSWDPGPGFMPTPYVKRLACGGSHSNAYVLANYVDEAGEDHGGSAFAKSRVLEIGLTSQAVTLLSETDTAASERWIASDIALAENSLVGLQDGFAAPLTSIALAGGMRTALTPGLDVGGLTLTPALAHDRVYVATFEGVDEIDLGVPDKRNVSVVDDTHPLVFSQVRSMGFDPANDRVIVGDEDLDTLIAIDITTGDRSKLLSREVGTGTSLIAPRRFALSSDVARAYVADDGSNAPARLFEIDLASGDRRVIGDIGPFITHFVTGLALDEEGDRIFVSGHDVILEVDLESEDVQTIAGTDSTVLEAVNDLLLDPANGRLLVGDFINDGIFGLDLTTHAIDIVSLETSKGAGPPFGGVVSFTRVGTTSELYVAGRTSGAVTRVDLESGDREELETNCDLVSPASQTLGQVLYNEALHELIISDDQLFAFDLDSAQCETLPSRVSVPSMQIQVTPTNQMLAVSFRALLQLDRETGEIVIVSK